MNFNNYDMDDMETAWIEDDDNYFTGKIIPIGLELVEWFAENEGFICSENELSERFDDGVAPYVIEQYGKVGEEFSDTCAINEAFSNWTDSLCKDGEIHSLQYAAYSYVGKWA